jgi:hypothetical protein
VSIFITGIILSNSSNIRIRFNPIKNSDILYILNTDEFPKYYIFTGERRRVLNAKIFLETISEPKIFFFGMGNGSSSIYLRDRVNYYRRNFFAFDPNATPYNFHNQYMETMMDFGIIGLFLLLMVYFQNIKSAFLNSNYLYLAFIILIGFSSLTESILERNKGIVFFAFFSNILLFLPDKKPKNNHDS